MTFFKHIALSTASLLAGLAISAAAAGSTFVVTEDELQPDVFPQVADSIRANLEGPNSPKNLSSGERRRVEDSLDRMEAMIEEDPVGNHTRIRNLQGQVNAILTPLVARNTANSNVVCERVKQIGSNIPTTVCRNRADRDADEKAAEEEIFRLRQLQSLETD